jgi:diguanylate cyclase (GGDEF)-like protein
LTGLHNYRFFLDRLTHEVDRCTQYGATLSVVLVDVDCFQRYNDRNGHEAGSRALATLAGILADSVRKVDIVARYGGEEFALVLPCTPKAGAQVLAERVRRSIELHPFPDGDDEAATPLTVSMGIATCPGDSTDVQELVRLADSARDLAKQDGLNRVRLYGRSDRSFRRVPTRLTGRLSLIPGQSHPFTTMDVSEGGMSLRVNRELPIGSLLEIELEVPRIEKDVLLNGRVIRGKTTASGEFRAGVSILSIAAKDRHPFTNYLRSRMSGTEDATDLVEIVLG